MGSPPPCLPSISTPTGPRSLWPAWLTTLLPSTPPLTFPTLQTRERLLQLMPKPRSRRLLLPSLPLSPMPGLRALRLTSPREAMKPVEEMNREEALEAGLVGTVITGMVDPKVPSFWPHNETWEAYKARLDATEDEEH